MKRITPFLALSLLILSAQTSQASLIKSIQPVEEPSYELKEVETTPILIEEEGEDETELKVVPIELKPDIIEINEVKEPELIMAEDDEDEGEMLQMEVKTPELEKETLKIETTEETTLGEPPEPNEEEDSIKLEIKPVSKLEFKAEASKLTIEENEETPSEISIELKEPEEESGTQFLIKEKDDCMSLTWSENLTTQVEICDDFKVEDNGLYLEGSQKDFQISSSVHGIIEKVKMKVQEEDADLRNVSLVLEEDEEGNESANYEFEIVEKRKLFWIIPVNVKAKLRMGVEDNKLKEVKYGLMGLFFRNKDYAYEFIVEPNLAISNVEITPTSLHTGKPMTIKVTVINNGIKRSGAGFTSEGGPSKIALYFGDDLKIQAKETGFFLEPGESETHTMTWSAILCDVPITVVVDPDNRIEETNESDNVWLHQTQCAPTDAPDLAVVDSYYATGSKKIGQPTTIRYTIKNQGTQPSGQAIAEFTFGNAHSTDPIPPLSPDETYVSNLTYTPENCNGAVLKLDKYNDVVEIDEDNNTGYEPASDCRKRPDLFVDSVWWKAGGVTAGDIHAGEELWFRVKVKNDPEDHSTLNSACINSFKAAVKLNGTTIKTLNYGKVGCIPNGSYSVPDYWYDNAEFTYTPKCNGETLTVEIDPQNAVLESLESNNSWNFSITCAAPGVVSTPI